MSRNRVARLALRSSLEKMTAGVVGAVASLLERLLFFGFVVAAVVAAITLFVALPPWFPKVGFVHAVALAVIWLAVAIARRFWLVAAERLELRWARQRQERAALGERGL